MAEIQAPGAECPVPGSGTRIRCAATGMRYLMLGT